MQLKLEQTQYRSDHSELRSKAHDIEKSCALMVSQFCAHTLKEQSAITLADRTDSKFLLPVRVLPRFLNALNSDYTILEEAGYRLFTYENTYFDTPAWDFYLQHHNGKLNRHKFRFRRYHETDISYFEKKIKTNKDRTVKERVSCTESSSSHMAIEEEFVKPSLYVNYRRLTLWNHADNERLTLDYDLCYRRPEKTRVARLEGLLIAELKRHGKANHSPFVKTAKDRGFSPETFSKYCAGVCLTDSGLLKSNRFKSTFAKIKKASEL
jgi:hypothetical protein